MHLLDELLKANAHVHVHEEKRAHVDEVLRSLIRDGRSMLHVVADFDFTLTMYEKDGVVLPSTFGVIESNDFIRVSANARHSRSCFRCIIRLRWTSILRYQRAASTGSEIFDRQQNEADSDIFESLHRHGKTEGEHRLRHVAKR